MNGVSILHSLHVTRKVLVLVLRGILHVVVIGIGFDRKLCNVDIPKIGPEVEKIAKVKTVLVHRVLRPRGVLCAVHCALKMWLVTEVEREMRP